MSFVFGIRRPRLAIFVVALSAASTAAQTGGEAVRPPLRDPSLLLLNDPAIHAELGLNPAEAAALKSLLLEYNDVLLAIRDTGAAGAPDALQPQIDELRAKLKRQLTAPQQSQLTGLVL